MLNKISVHVRFDVVHSDKRNILCQCKGFSSGQTYKHRTYQSRAMSSSNSGDVRKTHSGFTKGLIYHRDNGFYMTAGRHLRHDTPELPVECDL